MMDNFKNGIRQDHILPKMNNWLTLVGDGHLEYMGKGTNTQKQPLTTFFIRR